MLLCSSVSYPSSSYLEAKPAMKVATRPLIKGKCPTKRYRTTKKNKPACSPAQKASVERILVARGWRAVKVIRGVRTTGYSPGDGHTPGTRTACGVKARYGVVSVDPRIVRLGSHLYIPGYGFSQTLDTGGRIKGKRVDLCYNSIKSAREHGIKIKDVYVLVRAK